MIRKLLSFLVLLPSFAWAVCPTDHYGAVICGDSPNHWWRMDASTGTNEPDIGSAASLAGTYSGGFTLNTAGIRGAQGDKAVAFNGTTGKMLTGTGDSQSVPDSTSGHVWAAEAWLNLATLPSGTLQAVLQNGLANATQFAWRMGTRDNSGTIIYNAAIGNTSSTCAGNTYMLTQGGTPTTGTYHYMVIRTIGNGSGLSDMFLYVDANQIDHATTSTGTLGCGSFPINVAVQGNIFWLPGTVDEPALYGNPGLTTAKITAHYNAGLFHASSWPYTVKRDTLRPNKFGPSEPVVYVDAPGFLVDRLNKSYIRTPDQYATWILAE